MAHEVAPDFRHIFETAPNPYLLVTRELYIVTATDAYLAATYTKREEIAGRYIFEVFPDNPDDPGADGVANLRASFGRVLSDRCADTMAIQKYDIPSDAGGAFEERFWSPRNTPVFGADGEIEFIIHEVEDVTEFVRLRQGDANAADAFGLRSARLEAELYRRAQDLQLANANLRSVRANLEDMVDTRTTELAAAKDAVRRTADERSRAMEALARSETQLRQAQKLESLGRLAGGIAHDFNNLLTVILSYSDEMLAEWPEGTPWRPEVQQIARAGQRAAELTRQILAFSRQQVLEARPVDVNDVLRSVSRMLGRLLGEDVEVRFQLGSELGTVVVDPGQLEQVVMNLAVNARDAMPAGGRLTVETVPIQLGEAYARDHLDVRPGPYVQISVSDTGTGMTREVQERLFEPFFTTKPAGRGTGLGLATVFGIVKQSGGHIWVYSEVGRGTTFKIYLPVIDSPSVSLGRQPLLTPHGGSETLLVAEDDDALRAVACRMLGRAGYVVRDAGTPAEVLAHLADPSNPIDLLLTDVVMPKISGPSLAEAARKLRPGLRVLYMSGYADDAIFHHGVLSPGVAFIQKPLTVEGLLRKVRATLDAPGPAASGET